MVKSQVKKNKALEDDAAKCARYFSETTNEHAGTGDSRYSDYSTFTFMHLANAFRRNSFFLFSSGSSFLLLICFNSM